eukprot:TRINITY_DN1004_c0_g1_i2.p1 TRINITY_DN1004_c0_g1~~TRINITY_DN1004_c0_g1_i2.p1  ORF type:complete len:320 (-),score=107.04 TRINITY_DN1004_c0_g1_i2:112-1011(-)
MFYKIRGYTGDKYKAVEIPRGAPFAEVKAKVEAKFGGPCFMSFKKKDGSTVYLTQDSHLDTVIQETLAAGGKFIRLEVVCTKVSPSVGVSARPAAPLVSPAVTVAPIVTAPAPAASTGTCSKCHVPLVPGSRFCSGCGATVAAAAAAAAAAPAPVATMSASAATAPAAPPPARPPPVDVSASAAPKKDSNICGGCNLPVNAGVRALDKLWHQGCFVCTGCKAALSSGFRAQAGMPYCASCHNSLFAEKCASCQRAITGGFLDVGGQHYHTTCFVCSICKKPPEGTYRLKAGAILCSKCS